MPQLEYPPAKLRRYPHMFPGDIALWERFLVKFGNQYLGFTYDVKVGAGVAVADDFTREYAFMVESLSKYRIDVVGRRRDVIEIIEVKPEARSSAIGQALTYLELYTRDMKPTAATRAAIVTDRELPDMRELTSKLNINYYIV